MSIHIYSDPFRVCICMVNQAESYLPLCNSAHRGQYGETLVSTERDSPIIVTVKSGAATR